jgi:Sjoegren syndrome nuclear autoantigen 1
MAAQGASMQNYNNQLISCLEELKDQRDELNSQILREEEERAAVQREISILTERLSRVNESLSKRVKARTEYDRTIAETEAAYMKILESSQTLLHVLRREGVALSKRSADVK